MKRLVMGLCALALGAFALAQSVGVTLLSNASATGSTVTWPGGQGEVTCVGTVGGATLAFQYLGPDGTTWVSAGTNTTFTSLPNNGNFWLGNHSVRMTVTGGAPSGLYCMAELVQPIR